MANICPTSIQICRARFTRLNTDGTVAPGPNNHVVTDKVVQIEVEPEVEEGEDKTLISGCDCVCVSYRGKDKLKRFNLTLEMCDIEPALIELLTGASLLTQTTDAIGVVFPNQNVCGAASQPAVGVELWSNAWIGDAQAPPAYQYIRWVFPMSFWQLDSWTLQNDFQGSAFTGFTRANNAWANPYADAPTGATGLSGAGGFFWDDGPLPGVVCGYSTTST